MPDVDEAELLAVFAGALRVDVGRLSLDTRRDELPEWDSLGHVVALLAVEARWGVQLSLAQLEGVRSIGDVKAAVQRS
jgi:acyl carrier protein